MYRRFFKRLIDIVISMSALIALSPILLVVTVWLYYANKGAGAFFYQERPGKDAKLFKVVKFKTMTDERRPDGRLLPDVQRLTKVGRFVRSTSLDELPQLFNVLKGDMSLIGPRPLLPEYLWVFGDFQKRRHEVRPGISGWAQVHGRNHCKLSKKFEYDVWYVDHCTLSTDLKIVWLTIMNVLKRSDVGEGNADMKEIDDLGYLPKILKLLEEKKNAQGNRK
jgi:lipopolysaccharide/colanic/teichoic acid biosynthesis glycosyltransferase